MLIHLIRRTSTPCGGGPACGEEPAGVGLSAALLVGAGLWGNALCLLALRRLRRRPRDAAPSSGAHALLAALSAANLLAVASCAPLAARLLGLYQPSRWRWATWLQAHVEPCAAQLGLAAGALLVAALACQRWAAICAPPAWRCHAHCCSAASAVLCCCVAAALLASPLAVLSITCQVQNATADGGALYGIGDSAWAGEWAWPAYWWAWRVSGRLVPGALLAALPALVVRRLRQLAARRRRLRAASDKFRGRQEAEPQPQPQQGGYRGERRQVALLVAAAALWAATLLPAEALALWLQWQPRPPCHPLLAAAAGLELCSAALPCLAFLACSRQFRRAALSVVFCPLRAPTPRPAAAPQDSAADYGEGDRGPDSVHMEFVSCNGASAHRSPETVGILRCQSPA